MADNEVFRPQLRGDMLIDEAGIWYANCDPLYVVYISNNSAYGMDMSLWPATFESFVDLSLAVAACRKITGSDSMLEGPEGLLRRLKKAKESALSKDAMAEPTAEQQVSSWVEARSGGGRRSGSRWSGSGFLG
jgi:hypothetical protein